MNKNVKTISMLVLLLMLFGVVHTIAEDETKEVIAQKEKVVPTQTIAIHVPISTKDVERAMKSQVHKQHVGQDTIDTQCNACHGIPPVVHNPARNCDNNSCHPTVAKTEETSVLTSAGNSTRDVDNPIHVAVSTKTYTENVEHITTHAPTNEDVLSKSGQTEQRCILCELGNTAESSIGDFAKSFGNAIWHAFRK